MKTTSIWRETAKISKSKNVLEENMETDILIIGGGLSGLSTGIELLENNQKFMIVEKRICGMGLTSLSTGKLTFAQGLVYDNIIEEIYDQFGDNTICLVSIRIIPIAVLPKL